MKMARIAFLFSGLITAVSSCLDPYNPAIDTQNLNYLVVEGNISTGGQTSIRLSRTTGLSDTSTFTKVYDATVRIEGKSGFSHDLYGYNGNYGANYMELDPTDEYRLRIFTDDGKEYLSEYVPFHQSPEIDSIHWEASAKGVQVYVNTHDPQNRSWYYKWEYEETWEYNVPFISLYDYIGGQIVPSTVPKPNQCWQYHNSSSILIGSSAKLSRDIINRQPVAFVSKGTPKISSKYSILVRQQSLSRDAYEYFQQMRRNTEQTGSFFDPLPIEIRGNIYNVNDPEEPVIGFLTAGTVHEKRIFIRNEQVRPWGFGLYCDITEALPHEVETYLGGGSYLPLYIDPRGSVFIAPRHCFDCSRVASPQRPSFWE